MNEKASDRLSLELGGALGWSQWSVRPGSTRSQAARSLSLICSVPVMATKGPEELLSWGVARGPSGHRSLMPVHIPREVLASLSMKPASA